jgi:cyclopropane-fatty-acyl-phospholipid synthase
MEYFVQHIQPLLPDALVRIGLKGIMWQTTNGLRKKDWPEKELRLVDRIKQLDTVTFETDKANEQHYQVPTDFFKTHLGYRMKYSSCEWTNLVDTLEKAETYTLSQYQRKVGLDELKAGDIVLEIGNGWGSLCLFNARSYPHLQFESFSNSETQIAYIQQQIDEHKITNLKVWKQDIDDFVKGYDKATSEKATSDSESDSDKKYSRIISIECIEHCRAYNLLFKKLASILKSDGLCFFQILGHSKYSYLMRDDSWMGRNFFTGGTIPSMQLFSHFNDDLIVSNKEVINGKQYAKTLDAWLYKMYKHKKEVLSIFKEAYGKDAAKMYQGWRMFYLMCSESFGYNDGTEWCVGYITMKHK